jgi:hypothetical protein
MSWVTSNSNAFAVCLPSVYVIAKTATNTATMHSLMPSAIVDSLKFLREKKYFSLN